MIIKKEISKKSTQKAVELTCELKVTKDEVTTFLVYRKSPLFFLYTKTIGISTII